mmetsp:Transcript_12493/g.24038  ORF Transcript_12493/g.24038 Transcript_12493/m.24038 type:complete len:182 (-) Transcript_12493:74-619(-)
MARAVHEFTAELSRSEGTPLGLETHAAREGCFLKVKGVTPGKAVDLWNRKVYDANAHAPSIMVGSIILTINDHPSSQPVASDLLRDEANLRLKVRNISVEMPDEESQTSDPAFFAEEVPEMRLQQPTESPAAAGTAAVPTPLPPVPVQAQVPAPVKEQDLLLEVCAETQRSNRFCWLCFFA